MKLFKKLNKGFTLVELVVVIAVIAILAAVSVVAYTGITENARKTAAISEGRARYSEVYATDMMDGALDKDASVVSMLKTGETYTVEGGAVTAYSFTASNGYLATLDVQHGTWSAEKPAQQPGN